MRACSIQGILLGSGTESDGVETMDSADSKTKAVGHTVVRASGSAVSEEQLLEPKLEGFDDSECKQTVGHDEKTSMHEEVASSASGRKHALEDTDDDADSNTSKRARLC
ncbi:uncharacterized protein [Lolium perenne]|uniref:uncharacterized protein n=1 Tax=Lolium perenne TaxID=4522 RepID=UPI003A9A5B70